MFLTADLRPFATLAPVTVLLAVVRPEGVAIAADRAAVYFGHECAPGVPMLAGDRRKVFVTGHVVVGMAGHISAPTEQGQPTPDLLGLAQVASQRTHTMSATAGAIQELLATHAATLSSAYGPSAAPVDTLAPRVLTTALIGGLTQTGDRSRPQVPHLLEVALFCDGSVISRPVLASAAYGPDQAQERLRRWTDAAAHTPTLEAALNGMSELIQSAHLAAPALVTADFDTAQVSLTSPATHIYHPYVATRPPRF